jgi:catechol-2,3-dioxygenase
MWAKASISLLSELAREAGEAQPVGTADRCQRLIFRALAIVPPPTYIQPQEVLSRRSSTMADGTSSIVPATPTEAVTPRGINHLVINVRDIEESHKFWTETLGFKQVAYSKRRNGKMRFYSGDHDGRMNHHDIALCENPNLPKPPAEWSMFEQPVAINHIAIALPNREAWLKQLAWLRSKGVKFERRVNHGMTHSLYIVDPNGYGVEVLYELPREVWGDNIQGAIDYAEPVPTEGDEAFVDDTNYPRFGTAEKAAE